MPEGNGSSGFWQVWPKPVAWLKPYERNARTHSPEQVKQLAAAIKEWGWTMPILADERGLVIAGHARLQAAKLLKMNEVPVLVAQGWSDEQKRAYVIADNKLALNAGWDEVMLRAEIEALRGARYDLGLTGFEDQEIARLLDGATGPGAQEGEPLGGAREFDGRSSVTFSRVEVTIQEPRAVVQRGDVWRVGPHTLVCARPIDEWEAFKDELVPGVLLCPYPGVFVALAPLPEGTTLLLVQPDAYIAGHIIDQYRNVHGEETCRQEMGDPDEA